MSAEFQPGAMIDLSNSEAWDDSAIIAAYERTISAYEGSQGATTKPRAGTGAHGHGHGHKHGRNYEREPILELELASRARPLRLARAIALSQGGGGAANDAEAATASEGGDGARRPQVDCLQVGATLDKVVHHAFVDFLVLLPMPDYGSPR